MLLMENIPCQSSIKVIAQLPRWCLLEEPDDNILFFKFRFIRILSVVADKLCLIPLFDIQKLSDEIF